MKLKVKPFPAVMTALSALYLIYVRSGEDTTLVADAVGGDPGGKLMPTLMAVFLFAGFLYITLKERPAGEKMEKGTLILFFLTLGLSLVYVFLLKPVGFILINTVVLYTLEYVYTTIGEKRDPAEAVIGGAATLGVTVVLYLLMRFITKKLLALGGSGALPAIFSSLVFEAFISLVFTTICIMILNVTLCRKARAAGKVKTANAAIITFAVTLILYVVFKQFFSVKLAPGLINY